jgi:outer membrane protein OmpA-like peptidoglycan-associated protein
VDRLGRPRIAQPGRAGPPVLFAVAALVAAGEVGPATAGSAPVTADREPGAAGRTVTSSEGVEVATHGVVQVRPYQRSESPPATVAVHAVQRVADATVVYLSVGYRDPEGSAQPIELSELAQPGSGVIGGGALTSTRVVDYDNGLVLATVPQDSRPFDEPFSSPLSAFPTEPDVMGAVYAVLPPLTDGVTSVDVQVGFGTTVPDVPVGEGLLEPAVEDDELVPLGTGWPEPDPAALRDLGDTSGSVHRLSTVTEALDRSSVTTREETTVTVDLAADVLFARDSADLTPEAAAVIARVATDVRDQARTGRILVVGHTDSDASEQYNLDLSRRRAAAVAQALTAELGTDAPEIRVEGRGEAEPVADNGTDAGRQANRRVSITFEAAEEGNR